MIKIYFDLIRGNFSGTRYEVPKGSATIGRTKADISIDDNRVSMQHAELHFSGTRIILIDKDSTNGTFVNGRRITRQALKDNDIVSFGGLGEKASAVFKIIFIREAQRERMIFINKDIGKKIKWLSLVLIAFIVATLIWLVLPSYKEELAHKTIYAQKPWERFSTLEIQLDSSNAIPIILAMEDIVLLPTEANWKIDIQYDSAKDDEVFENRIYNTHIFDNSEIEAEQSAKAIYTVQRFKGNYTGNLQKDAIKNFVWHHTYFLKENNINAEFKYIYANNVMWQYVLWKNGEVYSLYATSINIRGRNILQASAISDTILINFFNYFITSLKIGGS